MKEVLVGKVARVEGRAGVPGMSEAELEALVARSRAGDGEAWQQLWLVLEPEVRRAAGRLRVMGLLARDEDELRAVVVCVMGALRHDDFRRLGKLCELLGQRDGSWRLWLSRISTNAGRNHVRGHADCLGRDEGGRLRLATYTEVPGEQEDEADPSPLVDALVDAHFDPSPHVDAHRILAAAQALLPAAQLDAIHRWLEWQQDTDGGARAQTFDGSEEEMMRLVRAGVARLRRRYAGSAAVRRRRTPPSARTGEIDRSARDGSVEAGVKHR